MSDENMSYYDPGSDAVAYDSTPGDPTAIYVSAGGTANVPEPIRHRYDVYVGGSRVGVVQFQRGPSNCPDSTRGLFLMHLSAICIDWLERAQRSVYACDANADALEHLRAAHAALQRRRDERAARGVLGTVAI